MTDLTTWLDEFTDELRHRDLADATVRVYLRGIRKLLAWLPADVTEPQQVDRRHIRDFATYLRDELGLSASARRTTLIAARLFFDYIATEEDLPNPAERIEIPNPTPPRVETADPEAVRKLLKHLDGRDFRSRRDAAIIRLLASTGVRRSELVGIDVEDLDLAAKDVLIKRGKGGRPRVVPFGSRTALALRRYLRAREQRHPDTDALFISSSGTPRRIDGGTVNAILVRRCDEAGIPRIRPHQLRHAWAATAKRRGLPDDYLERLAGWAPGSPMTRRYGASVAEEDARDALRRLEIDDLF